MTMAIPVLIIDDDVDTRDALRMVLEDEGYSVEDAGDAVTGHRLLLASLVPLTVLLDHKLLVMDGCDLLDLVEHDQALRRHAFVFITAASAHSLQEDCDDLPDRVCVAVLYKPFQLDEVLAAVAQAEQHLRNTP
jgi:CheY-like chemotaxis protein